MKLLITGATGLIGRTFLRHYGEQHEVTVLSRSPQRAQRILGNGVRVIANLNELDSSHTFDGYINLAGEPIAEKRWSDQQKQRIQHSRMHITEQLVALSKAAKQPPQVFISGSAIGFYGRQSSAPVTETKGTPHNEFSHQLCHQWEQLANSAASEETRVCLLRTGIVLADQGGALQRMAPPFKFGLGGPIGNGEQMMSWIHVHDMVAIIQFLLEHKETAGAYNCTAPAPVSNNEFSKTLGKVLNRPVIFRVPAFVMRLAFGEMADLLLTGQAVLPERLEQAGYTFQYRELQPALSAIYR